MKTIKRHWHMVLVLVAAVVLAGTWSLRNGGTANTAMADPLEPLDIVQHDAVLTLLGELSLDREALVALNLSSNQCESILTSVRNWQDTNALTLASLRATIAQRVQALRNIERTIRMGPANEEHPQALATAHQELATAKTAYTTALSSIESTVNQALSGSQRTTWSAIQGGLTENLPLRMVGMTAQERLTMSRAWRHCQWMLGAATSAQERAAAETAWNGAITGNFSQGQQNVLAAYSENFVSASEVVADAFDEVMPQGV